MTYQYHGRESSGQILVDGLLFHIFLDKTSEGNSTTFYVYFRQITREKQLLIGIIEILTLLLHTFCALQRLAPAISDGVDDPVPLLFTDNKVLFFQDAEVIGQF